MVNSAYILKADSHHSLGHEHTKKLRNERQLVEGYDEQSQEMVHGTTQDKGIILTWRPKAFVNVNEADTA